MIVILGATNSDCSAKKKRGKKKAKSSPAEDFSDTNAAM